MHSRHLPQALVGLGPSSTLPFLIMMNRDVYTLGKVVKDIDSARLYVGHVSPACG